jgi:hypothetical protein
MVSSAPFQDHMPHAVVGMIGIAPPAAPPDDVKMMFGRKTAPPPPSI